jgi:hypothetical protein
MKGSTYKSIIVLFLIGTLTLSLPGSAKASIFLDVKNGIKSSVHSLKNAFRGAKKETVRTTRTVKHVVAGGFRTIKNEAKNTTSSVGHGVVKGVRGAKAEAKQTVKTVKHGIVKGLKDLKNI